MAIISDTDGLSAGANDGNNVKTYINVINMA